VRDFEEGVELYCSEVERRVEICMQGNINVVNGSRVRLWWLLCCLLSMSVTVLTISCVPEKGILLFGTGHDWCAERMW
jgi:hypothetical protein